MLKPESLAVAVCEVGLRDLDRELAGLRGQLAELDDSIGRLERRARKGRLAIRYRLALEEARGLRAGLAAYLGALETAAEVGRRAVADAIADEGEHHGIG